VSSWALDEDFPVYPVGSKPKRMLICPENVTDPHLIPGHAYLFKTAEGWRAQQVWAELIAYRIAALVGLDVPPCFIAIDSAAGLVGSLLEFFYGYPNEDEPARLVHGADVICRFRVSERTDRPMACEQT
jgi:hypothetical protein